MLKELKPWCWQYLIMIIEPKACRYSQMAGKPLAVIDCFGILDDDTIREYFRLGCEVKALGRGHVQRLKKEELQ